MADSAPVIGGLAWKACYPADFSAQPVWVALEGQDAKLDSERELTNGNFFFAGLSKIGITKTVLFSSALTRDLGRCGLESL
jgi:hypothetical protein